MITSISEVSSSVISWFRESFSYFVQPFDTIKTYSRQDLRPDLIAGLTIAIVLLPQAIAYALIAELPPQTGLYTAIVAAIVAGLWGSSLHLHTGPTNAASLLVLATLLPVAEPGSAEFLIAAGVLAFFAGFIKMLMGLFRLGFLVFFVADSVITGFTAGAGVLIAVSQLRPLLRLDVAGSPFFATTIGNIYRGLGQLHGPSLALGLMTITVMLLLKKFRPKLPATLIAMILSGLAAYFLSLETNYGIRVLGDLPRNLPPLQSLPLTDLDLIRQIWPGIIAAATVGLVEAMSIARSFATQSGQRLDTNQEMVGQGLASIVAGMFSGYATSGSFTRSAINYEAKGKTRMTAVFSGLWVIVALLLFAPLFGYIPRAALAGVIIITAVGMVDLEEFRRTRLASSGDTRIMLATTLACFLVPIQYAVLVGVFVSFVRYIYTTSTPGVPSVLPDQQFEHFVEHESDQAVCPQLGVMTIQGSLYFGAVHHVEEEIRHNKEINPRQQFLLLRMHHVNHCDMTGIHMLEAIVRLYRQTGGDVFMMRVTEPVMERMEQTGFNQLLGLDNFMTQENAIAYLFDRVLDPAICIYHCQVRAWKECQKLPKSYDPAFIPAYTLEAPEMQIPSRTPHELWQMIVSDQPVIVLDVRELTEWAAEGYIPRSINIPLPRLLERDLNFPPDSKIVLISRTGRRSRHLIQYLNEQGLTSVYNLRGGILNWRSAYLPFDIMPVAVPMVRPKVSMLSGS